jgi:hypothetical protein
VTEPGRLEDLAVRAAGVAAELAEVERALEAEGLDTDAPRAPRGSPHVRPARASGPHGRAARPRRLELTAGLSFAATR